MEWATGFERRYMLQRDREIFPPPSLICARQDPRGQIPELVFSGSV